MWKDFWINGNLVICLKILLTKQNCHFVKILMKIVILWFCELFFLTWQDLRASLHVSGIAWRLFFDVIILSWLVGLFYAIIVSWLIDYLHVFQFNSMVDIWWHYCLMVAWYLKSLLSELIDHLYVLQLVFNVIIVQIY